jgi:dTDP-4-dehydrorhamnose 3,5-epimerase
MEKIPTDIPDVFIIKPNVFEDNRGYFYESFNKSRFNDLGIEAEFVQDNQSLSEKNVLRGLHFQNPPYQQGKLVRVIKGSVLDVAVDIRKNSPYFGKHISCVLSEKNKLMLWVPPGFAHGFLTLEDNTIFFYKCTQQYNKESEGVILYNDPDLNIKWNIASPTLADRDKNAPLFKNYSF